MWPFLAGILGPVGEVVSTYFKGKVQVQEAQIEREVKALTNEADWDKVQAEASKDSWKDEWLTILISIPLIMAFFPGLASYIDDGFKILEQCPEWYRYLVGVVFAASFGIKKVTDVFGRKQ
jgi:hypothetical protein